MENTPIITPPQKFADQKTSSETSNESVKTTKQSLPQSKRSPSPSVITSQKSAGQPTTTSVQQGSPIQRTYLSTSIPYNVKRIGPELFYLIA